MSKDGAKIAVTITSRIEKWDGIVKDRGDGVTDPRCYEVVELTEYPDGRRETKVLKRETPHAGQ